MKFVKHYLIIFVCNWKFLKSFLFRTSVSSFLVLVNVYEEKILFFLSALVKLHLTNRLNLINAESLSPFVFAEHVNTTNEKCDWVITYLCCKVLYVKKVIKKYIYIWYTFCAIFTCMCIIWNVYLKSWISIFTQKPKQLTLILKRITLRQNFCQSNDIVIRLMKFCFPVLIAQKTAISKFIKSENVFSPKKVCSYVMMNRFVSSLCIWKLDNVS